MLIVSGRGLLYRRRIQDSFGGSTPRSLHFDDPLWPRSRRAPQVAINGLPNNRETLWLRILGKGKTQQQAIEQLLKLPRTDPFRNDVLQEIARLQILLEKNKKNATNDDLGAGGLFYYALPILGCKKIF